MAECKQLCDISKTDVPDSSGSKDLSKSLAEEASSYFLQAKEAFFAHDYSFAVQILVRTIAISKKYYGEMSVECAELYLLYGKALLRSSQQEAGVFSVALNEVLTDGEENELSESTVSQQGIIDEGCADVKGKNSEDIGEVCEPTERAEHFIKDTSTSTAISEDSELEESMSEDTEVEEDDLELAWNTLEAAKSIFKSKNTVEAQLKVAEASQLLGEICIEVNNYSDAITDLSECLELKKKHLEPDDITLVEVYFLKGLAFMHDKKYTCALYDFNNAKRILEQRFDNLKSSNEDDTISSSYHQIEIYDLESVLLDINEKIGDIKELLENQKKEQEELMEVAMMFSSAVKEKDEKSSPAKPVSNITPLLKRKKPDEGTSADSAKRIKVTAVVNGETNVTETEAKKAEG